MDFEPKTAFWKQKLSNLSKIADISIFKFNGQFCSHIIRLVGNCLKHTHKIADFGRGGGKIDLIPLPQKKMLPPEKKPYFRGGRARLLRVCHRFIPPHSTSNGYFTTFETSLEADYQKSCFDAIFDAKKFGRFPYQKNKCKKQHEK